MMAFKIRPIQEDEIKSVYKWLDEDRWPVNMELVMLAYKADPKGWLVAVQDDGTIIGSIYGAKLSGSIGFITNFYVREDLRRQGVGKQLWDACVTYLGNCNICLDAILQASGYYRKRGFKNDFYLDLYSGKYTPPNIPNLSAGGPPDVLIEKYIAGNFDAVVAYDSKINMFERKQILEEFLESKATSAFVAKDTNGMVIGYGCVSTSDQKALIGPVFADDSRIAQNLVINLLSCCEEGQTLFMFVPTSNSSFVDFVKTTGLKTITSDVRMYSQDMLKLDVCKLFCRSMNLILLT